MKIRKTVNSLISSYSQVIFEPSPLSGAIVLLGVVVGAVAEGRGEVAWGALVATATALLTTALVGDYDRAEFQRGGYGFSAVLVGCATMSFFAPSPLGWTLLIMASALAVIVQRALTRLLEPYGVGGFTMPFVLCTWLVMASARMFVATDSALLPHPMLPTTLSTYEPLHANGLLEIVVWVLRGVGQIFLLPSALAGLLFLVALAVGLPRAAVWAFVGSALGVATGALFGASVSDLSLGLFSFSPALTAVALGCRLRHDALLAIVGAVVTAFVQAAMDVVLEPVGLPALTAPFCLTTWLMLLATAPTNTHPTHKQTKKYKP